MPRARNIKPGFFKNEILGGQDPYLRILFAGLWTLADRDGRLEDRPLRIKAELLPWDLVDANLLLTTLASFADEDGKPAFIERYEVSGKKYIQVVNFVKHNHFHKDEKPRGYPAKPEKPGANPVQAPVPHDAKPSEIFLLNSEIGTHKSEGGGMLPDFDPSELPPPVRRPQSHPTLLAVRKKLDNDLYDWLSDITRAQAPNQEAVVIRAVEQMGRTFGDQTVIDELAALGGPYVSAAYIQANRNLTKRYPDKAAQGAKTEAPRADISRLRRL